MAEATGTKMVADIDPSPMPVLLTTPSRDARYGDATVFVIPGLIRLGSGPYEGKVVTWLNKTGDEVTFTLDGAGAGQFFDLDSTGPGPFTIPDGKQLSLPVKPYPSQNRIFPYRVDCKATPGRPAQGGSPPQVSCP